jgi:type IV pilus assembly protein PilB
MATVQFGEVLGRLVHLSRLDVEEILQEQKVTHRRFGQIAMEMGFCAAQDVWQAWCEQLLTQVPRVDLDSLGVDSQAAAMFHRDVAMRLTVIPIRRLGHVLVVAVCDPNTDRIEAELGLITDCELRFVLADAQQIQRVMNMYYPAPPAAA